MDVHHGPVLLGAIVACLRGGAIRQPPWASHRDDAAGVYICLPDRTHSMAVAMVFISVAATLSDACAASSVCTNEPQVYRWSLSVHGYAH